MKIKDKVVVVTGGAEGIGRALCRRFATEGAQAVVVADIDAKGASSVAKEIDGLAITTNVAIESDVINLVKETIKSFGRIDVFCSNAGIGGMPGGAEVTNQAWQQIWDVNVMAHIYAARAILPEMIARGSGYLLNT